MIHEVLQFTSLIAVRCALHRYEIRDIRSLKVVYDFIVFLTKMVDKSSNKDTIKNQNFMVSQGGCRWVNWGVV